MKGFSLSRFEALPETVEVQGRRYAIQTDFRVILRIFRMLVDPEIVDSDKGALLMRMFFKGAIPTPTDAERAFEWFVRCGREKDDPNGERDFDYEQDSIEIYSAFRQVYGIDLMGVQMHWWMFSALLEGVFATENALSNKVRMRHIDDSDAQRKAAVERQKRAVKLVLSVNRTEAALEDAIRERLLQGLSVDDLIGR